jgi:hypothetical protein
MMTTIDYNKTPLPQPDQGDSYEYILCDDINNRFFASFTENQLVWVLKSKGYRTKPSSDSEQLHQQPDESTAVVTNHRFELFLRARVIGWNQENTRIQVRYPKGSTYEVRPTCVQGVLEHIYSCGLVLVASETTEYRRLCQVHTLEHETFLEIGSDLGICVNRMSKHCKRVIGIDKSLVSMEASRASYPQLEFVQWDVLKSTKCPPLLLSDDVVDLVVAIDINGSRDLPAVLQCLSTVWNVYHWKPRLIIVKSRTLYERLKHCNETTSD